MNLPISSGVAGAAGAVGVVGVVGVTGVTGVNVSLMATRASSVCTDHSSNRHRSHGKSD